MSQFSATAGASPKIPVYRHPLAIKSLKIILPVIISAPLLIYSTIIHFQDQPENTNLPQILNCSVILILVASYWLLESLPLGITSLLPALLFPLFGIIESGKIASSYSNDLISLFIASYTVALSLQRWNVHKRFALNVLCRIGVHRPRLILGGFMILSWFMSQWLSNTCTAAMLVPMANTIGESLYDLHEAKLRSASEENHANLAPSSSDGKQQIPSPSAASEKPPLSKQDLKALNATRRYSKSLLLGIAYSCSLGGVCTLVGTATNLMMASQIKRQFPKYGSLNFAVWLLFATPLSIILLTILYIWLLIFFVRRYRFPKGDSTEKLYTESEREVDSILSHDVYLDEEELKHDGLPLLHNSASRGSLNASHSGGDLYQSLGNSPINGSQEDLSNRSRSRVNGENNAVANSSNILQIELASLGRIKREEVCVVILFAFLCLLWITRDLSFLKSQSSSTPVGWSIIVYFLTGRDYVSDASCALIVCVILFLIPARGSLVAVDQKSSKMSKDEEEESALNSHSEYNTTLMDWDTVRMQLPWRIVLLLGAGFALSYGFQEGHFSEAVGRIIAIIGKKVPILAFLFILCAGITMLTEVSSNVATCSLLLPILAHLSLELNQNPLLLMIPASLCCSFAFMLPISTPPNAIAYSYGTLKMRDMLLFGFLMNCSALLVSVPYVLGMGRLLLGIELGEVPEWANG